MRDSVSSTVIDRNLPISGFKRVNTRVWGDESGSERRSEAGAAREGERQASAVLVRLVGRAKASSVPLSRPSGFAALRPDKPATLPRGSSGFGRRYAMP